MAAGDSLIRVVLEAVDKATPELAKLRNNIEKTSKDLEKSSTTMASSSRLAVAGLTVGLTAVVAGFAAAVKSAADYADGMGKAAQSTGLAVEEFSGLTYAAELSDVTMEQLSTALQQYSSYISKAVAGNKEAAATFDNLGISLYDVEGNLKSNNELFLEAADRISQLKDNATKIDLVKDLFGKSGAQLLPMLNSGKEGIKALTDEAERMGLVVSQETAVAAEQFNDNLTRLSKSMRGMLIEIASPFVKWLADITEKFREGSKEGGTFEGVIRGVGQAVFSTLNGLGGLPKSADALAIAEWRVNNIYQERLKTIQRIKQLEADQKSSLYVSTADAIKMEDAKKKLKELTDQLKVEISNRDELSKSAARQSQANKALKDSYLPLTEEEKKATQEAEAEAKKRDQLIKTLEDEAATLGMNKYQKTLYTAEQLASKMASEQEALAFLQAVEAAARKIKKYDELIQKAKEHNDIVDEEIAKNEEARQKVENSIKSLRQRVEDLQFENDLVGLGNVAREKAIITRQLEKDGVDLSTEAMKQYLATLEQELQIKEDQATLTDLLRDTDIKKTEDLMKKVDLLNKAYFDGINGVKISDEEYTQAMNKLLGETKKTTDEMTKVWENASQAIQQSLSTFLFDFMQGKMDNLPLMVKTAMDRVVAEVLAAKAMTALFGNEFGKTGNIGGLFGSLFQGFFADGGSYDPFRPMIVGEQGPEMIVPSTSGTVLSNDQIMKTPVEFKVYALDSQDVLRSMEKIKRELSGMIIGTSNAYNLTR